MGGNSRESNFFLGGCNYPGGTIVQGAIILGGNCLGGGNCPGGNCLGGNCPGGKYPGGSCPVSLVKQFVLLKQNRFL